MTVTITRAETPPRVDLLRMTPFGLVREASEDGDGLTLDGYAAVFNRETVIDSWEGRFKERLSPGSMKKSFRELRPRIQFDHGHHPLIGSIPIATPADGYPREDSHPELAPDGGAHIVGRLATNWLVEPVREAIGAGTINGMSFRFSVVRESWYDADGKQIRDERVLRQILERTWMENLPDEELPVRDLREVKVPELGPVVWPAYADTSVGVRSRTLTVDMGNLRDREVRKELARAVFLADVAERMASDDAPELTEDQLVPAEDHVDSSENEGPQATEETVPAGAHPSQISKRRMEAELAYIRSLIEIRQRNGARYERGDS